MDALYAFNRITDDFGDEEGVPVDLKKTRLTTWRDSLQIALGCGDKLTDTKTPDTAEVGTFWEHPALPAIADIARKHKIPAEYFFAVIDGVEMDLNPTRMRTFADLQQYCYHVAGAVGLCCIHVWGFRNEDAKPLAIDCGLALQLTNILRDIGEDAGLGRVYLPQEDLDRFGYTADDLRARVMDDRFRNLMRFEVGRAKKYYSNAEALFVHLEPHGRRILRAMIDIYGGLLIEIERRNYDVFSQRVAIPKWKKLWFAGRAMIRS